MRRRTSCISCGNVFWSAAKKSKFDGGIIVINNVCQKCLNRMRHAENVKHRVSVKGLPEGFEREIRMRELVNAEMARRREASAKKGEEIKGTAMNVNIKGDKK